MCSSDLARQLSGGNLQKVVLGREFSGRPSVLVAASPTRGLDVAAIASVHGYLRDAAADGMAILLISEDLDEILGLAHRVAVLYEGELVGEGDFEAQTRQVFDNLDAVLSEAGASLDAIVKITVYLTDIGTLRDFGRIKADYISGEQPASTALEVSSLALPGMMIEVEAIAAM